MDVLYENAVVSVDYYGREFIFSTEILVPYRGYYPEHLGKWIGIGVQVPQGSIKKLIGRDLTWNDEPVELKELITMKTIEERADEYASRAWSALNEEFNEDHTIFENIVSAAFVAGAKSEREELLRWHDPKKELPETDVEVLVMVHADGHTYDVMRYNKHGWWQKAPGGGWCAAEHAPIGWRHIHEI